MAYLLDLATMDTFHSGQALWATISGNCIEQYQLGKTMGKGEFGKVKKCTDSNTGVEYAVKIVDIEMLARARMTEQFCREVEALANMRHDHIVKLVDLLQTDKHYFVVMELVQGVDLVDRLMGKDGPAALSEPVCRRYFQQIVSAVAYLHMSGICHRDIKLENIMVDENDNIKMLDFGFCQSQNEGDYLKTICGSIDYSAPEVIQRPPGGYDGFAADIWSLGCLLYVLLVGRLPFRGKSQEETIRKISNCQMSIPTHVSTNGVNLLVNTLKINPKSRLTIKDVLEHPWIKQNWKDNVRGNVYDEKEKLRKNFSSMRKAREARHEMNAFELIAELTCDSVNSLVLDNFVGTTTRPFLCRGDPTEVGRRVGSALMLSLGNPESTKLDYTELSGYVSVCTGVVVYKVDVMLQSGGVPEGGKLCLVSIHRLRGTEREFVNYCDLIEAQVNDIIVTRRISHDLPSIVGKSDKGNEPTMTAFEMMAALNKINLIGLHQQEIMKAIAQRDAFLVITDSPAVPISGKKSLATIFQTVIAKLRDEAKVLVFCSGPHQGIGHTNQSPLVTFAVNIFRVTGLEGKVLLRLEMGQGIFSSFKDLLVKTSEILSQANPNTQLAKRPSVPVPTGAPAI